MVEQASPAPPPREVLEAWDDAHLWHPFTPHSVYRQEDPLTVVAGEGNYLIDLDGRRYLDGVSSLWCNAFGHRRTELDDAIRAQLDRIAHATLLGHASVPAILLAKRLAEIAPRGLEKVFFSDDGSTAVEVALKISYQYWQQAEGGRHRRRTRIVGLTQAYHGDTVGAVSVGGIDLFHSRFRPLLFEAVRAPAPDRYRCAACRTEPRCSRACFAAFEQAVRAQGDEVAAVVIEPGFQGAAGIIPYPPGFLQHVARVTADVGALLICDEVAAGMGRSGAMFACEKEGIAPDLLCIAKGLTGGYLPLAATLATRRIFEAFLGPPEEGLTFFHGHTYTGNALGCAAALATLDIFARESVIAHLGPKIARLGERVAALRALAPVGDVRHYGLAAGIELVADRDTRAPFPASERRGYRVCHHARERGVFLRPLGDVIVLMPPLSIEEAEIDLLVDAVAYGIGREFGASP